MLRRRFCLSWMLMLIAGLCLTVSAAQAGEIKLALDSPPDLEKSGTYVWARAFADHLTANKMVVKEYPVNALGNEAERLDQASQGLLEVSMSDLSRAGQLEPAIMGFMLPFLWDDMEHLDRALVTSGLLKGFNEKMSKKGVRVLSLVALGNAVGITNTKKTIRSVDDMKGMRMRAMVKPNSTISGGVTPWWSHGPRFTMRCRRGWPMGISTRPGCPSCSSIPSCSNISPMPR
jgi:TRAP-type C4-dicarboxylate transport system substrate-binding protein